MTRRWKRQCTRTVLLSDISGVIGKLNYNGRNGEADFLIQSENFKIGTREDEVDACLKSAAVSRIHARIVREGRGISDRGFKQQKRDMGKRRAVKL